jgi:hypothetical protein
MASAALGARRINGGLPRPDTRAWHYAVPVNAERPGGRGGSGPSRLWTNADTLGLNVVAFATVLYAGWFLYIALGLGSVTAIDLELRILAGGVGAAMAIAAALMFLRRREDIVAATLGAFTAASFALGVAQMTQPDAAWRVLFPAALFGGLLVGFLAFRGAFRQS